MNKKLLFTLSVVLGLGLLYFNINLESKAEKQKRQYADFVKEHPYSKTLQLSKIERKTLGLPPNKYYEQEYLNEINPNTGRTHPENIFEVQKKIASERIKRRVPGDAANNAWVERGPNNVGGRTRAILFDPNDVTNKRVFAGGVSGGLWVNNDITDVSSSWLQVGISENLAITCITVDPNNSQILYLGTGESYTSDNGVGNGVWKSVDGGNTWANVFNDSSSSLRDRIFFINTILAWNNPLTNKTEVFIGVGGSYYRPGEQFLGSNKNGLFKSINDGDSWTKIALNTTNGTPYEPDDFEVSADNTIWLATKRNVFGHGGGTILKSTDGNNFTVEHSITNGRRTQIAVSKTDKDKIYVLAEGSGDTPIVLLKTDDAFATTTDMTLPKDADTGIPENDFTRGQAFYDLVIETDPTNDATLYVGGIDLFRSIDSGVEWQQMSKWSNNNNLETTNVPLVHPDQHGFVFHPTDANKAIISNDGGVYYASSLSGATEDIDPNTNISERNKDYNTLQFYHGAIGQDTNSDVLIAGAQDNGTPFIANAANNSFNPSIDVYGGDGAYSFIDKDGEYMIVSYIHNDKITLSLPYQRGNFKRLDDDADSGSFINPQDLDDNLDILYANAHSTDPKFDSIVRYTGIKISEDLVKKRIGNPLLDSRVSALKVSPFTTSSTTLFLGLANGKLLKVLNAETDIQTWSDISGTEFSGSISAINFGKSEEEIFVTFHNYGVKNIWYTTDGGLEWQNKEGNFPDIPVKDIMMNPLNNDQVIIATELGIWATSNFKEFAPKWEQSNNGMSNVKVTSLSLRTADNTVLATTYGRGMFTGKFTAAVASVDAVVSGNKVFTVYPTISNGNFTIQAKNELRNTEMNIFDISGRQVYRKNVDFTTNNKQTVSTNLKGGVYIVNLITEGNKKSSRKIIIE